MSIVVRHAEVSDLAALVPLFDAYRVVDDLSDRHSSRRGLSRNEIRDSLPGIRELR